MRIEKINDNQIRCTLNKKDLSDRELRISELAYGTDKAKALFRDMVQQASYEFDTRFSTFSESPDSEDYEPAGEFTFDDDDEADFDDDEDIYELAGNISSDDEEIPLEPTSSYDRNTDFISLSEALGMEPRPKNTDKKVPVNIARIFSFKSINDISLLADNLCHIYTSENTLYKNDKTGEYILIMQQGSLSPESFNRICNLSSEYGTQLKNVPANISYFEEHFEPLIKYDALQKLV